MIRAIVAYVVTAIAFAGLDAVWLTQMGPRLYRPVLGDILLPAPRLEPAVAFYAIYMFGVVWFAIWPGLASGKWTRTLLNGALFGAIAYATYDLTNQATLKVWSTWITLADIAWGAFATATAASVGWFVARMAPK